MARAAGVAGAVEEGGVEVGLEVVDGHERHVPGQCQGLGGGDPHDEGAEQARAGRGGDRVGNIHAGVGQRLLDGGGQQLQVGPAGDLGHHAAERPVQVDLAGNNRRAHLVPAGHDRGRRLIARRLDAQHCDGTGRRHLDSRRCGSAGSDGHGIDDTGAGRSRLLAAPGLAATDHEASRSVPCNGPQAPVELLDPGFPAFAGMTDEGCRRGLRDC